MKGEFVGVAIDFAQFIAKPPLHGQQQLNAAGAATHHSDGGLAHMDANALQQGQPAVIELLNRLDGNCVFGSARNVLQLRCGADVDRQLVIRHGRAVAANHLLVGPVQADHFIAVQARTRKYAQTREVDVNLVVVVMPSHVTRQHAGVGRVHIGANEGEAHAWNGLHAKTFQHTHMAVATAHQNDVPQNRLVAHVHLFPASVLFNKSLTSLIRADFSVSGANKAARPAHCCINLEYKRP